MSEFKRVGAEVAFGECLVDIEAVQPIHTIAVTELMLAARSPKIDFSDNDDRLAYSIYCRQPADDSQENNDRYVTVRLTHESIPQSMRLSLDVRTFYPNQQQSNKRICYKFETLGDELVQAKKEVYFVFGNREIRLDENNELVEGNYVERKMYEKPVEYSDCESVVGLLAKTIRRVRV